MVTGNRTTSVTVFSDDSLTQELRKQSHLSLLLDDDALSWAVTEKGAELVREIGRVYRASQSLQDTLNTTEVLASIKDARYGSASLALRSSPVSLVPKSLFQQSQSGNLLKLISVDEGGNMLNDEVPPLSAVAVYRKPEVLDETIRDWQPELQLKSNAALVLSTLMAKNRFDRPPQLYAEISESFTEVYVAARKKVLLYNTFPTTSDEDVLYHINNCLQQLDLDVAETTLYLSGDIVQGSQRFELFNKYHPKLQLHLGFDLPRLAGALSAVRKQNFMALLNQFRCVS